jgi:hypothetical protein
MSSYEKCCSMANFIGINRFGKIQTNYTPQTGIIVLLTHSLASVPFYLDFYLLVDQSDY